EMTLRLSAKVRRKGGAAVPLAFRAADADRKAPRYASGFEILGILDGWKVDASAAKGPLTGVWVFNRPVTFEPGDVLAVGLAGSRASRVRVSISPFAPGDLTTGKLPEGLDASVHAVNAADDFPGSPGRTGYLMATAWDEKAFAKVVA